MLAGLCRGISVTEQRHLVLVMSEVLPRKHLVAQGTRNEDSTPSQRAKTIPDGESGELNKDVVRGGALPLPAVGCLSNILASAAGP